jgi:F0F1-type ATP synthase membrane subunit b/b'
MNPNPDMLMEPTLQWGFAGFCLLLLGVVVWLIKQLLRALDKNQDVINKNTQAVQEVTNLSRENRELQIEVKDKLLSRPCLLKPDHQFRSHQEGS